MVIPLIDQSDAVAEPDTTGPRAQSKVEFAAAAINRCIFEVIASCRAGTITKDRCWLAVIGYRDARAQFLFGGKASELEARQLRVETVERMVSAPSGGWRPSVST